jgi:hypothetical protein
VRYFHIHEEDDWTSSAASLGEVQAAGSGERMWARGDGVIEEFSSSAEY